MAVGVHELANFSELGTSPRWRCLRLELVFWLSAITGIMTLLVAIIATDLSNILPLVVGWICCLRVVSPGIVDFRGLGGVGFSL